MHKQQSLNKKISKKEIFHLLSIGVVLVLIFVGISITGLNISYVVIVSILVIMDVTYLIYKNTAIKQS
ncbi:MAG: hypothetical protein HRU38_08375 [Saccharospirillaceae bacterium]|nr:hypothetical protein [Pseudomonadales bacterium]NRB78669.1 hypothetical protein [Saccharospirillaceae bacterium]